MELWSSILEAYHRNRRNVHRYGLCLALFVAALYTGRLQAALSVFLAVPVLYGYDRWGAPWRMQGEKMMKPKTKT